jgi:hypothetical protein
VTNYPYPYCQVKKKYPRANKKVKQQPYLHSGRIFWATTKKKKSVCGTKTFKILIIKTQMTWIENHNTWIINMYSEFINIFISRLKNNHQHGNLFLNIVSWKQQQQQNWNWIIKIYCKFWDFFLLFAPSIYTIEILYSLFFLFYFFFHLPL